MRLLIDFFVFIIFGVFLYFSFLPFLRKLKIGQFERTLGVSTHQIKKGTPTMGGIIMLILIVFYSILLYLEDYEAFNNIKIIIILLFSIFSYFTIGFIDDYLIVVKKNNEGLNPLFKFTLMMIQGIILYYLLLDFNLVHDINLFGVLVDLKFIYGLFICFLFVGVTNASNLTDGIDGLLTCVSLISFSGLLYLSYYYEKMLVFYFCLSIICALFSFLFFNIHKAMLFMGNCGSLLIGASLVAVCIILEVEILIFFFGFIYFLETISVILQVWYFKKTKGKRLIRMSPLHHHFELIGFNEYEICLLFMLIQMVFTLLGVVLGVYIL